MAMEGGRTGLRAGRTGGRVCGVATRSVPRRGAPASRGNPARTVTCMAKKQNRVVVTLECTEQKGSGVPGISRYNTTKNKRTSPDRLELMKYNKYLRRHTLHREIKK